LQQQQPLQQQQTLQPPKTPLEKLQEQLHKKQQRKMFMQDVATGINTVKMEYKTF